MLYGYGKTLKGMLGYRWTEELERAHEGPTLGSQITESRKGLRQTPNALLSRNPELADIITPEDLNEIEHERLDIREHADRERLLKALAQALELPVALLESLAEHYPRAHATAVALNRELSFQYTLSRAGSERTL